jgi:NADPH:quinone reductase-like Zn-dependent oxidoreductase/NAD(P)-dependent dehydrogenase (short-subunit alcohol dehydrogenase family)/SAM-dependent methyltransferase
MAMEAVQQMCPPSRTIAGYYFKEAHFMSPIVIKQAWEDRTETMLHLRPVRRPNEKESGWSDITIYSYTPSDDQWTECFRASIQVQYHDAVKSDEAIRERRLADGKLFATYQRAMETCTRPIDSQVFYDDAAEHGIKWGEWFQVLGDINWDGDARTIGRVNLGKSSRHRTTSLVHPAVLDAAFHALRVSTTQGLSLSSSNTNIPVKLVDAWFAPSGWQQPDPFAIQYLATAQGQAGRDRSEGAIYAFTDDGSVLCSMGKLIMAAVSSSSTESDETRAKRLLHSIEWKPQLGLLDPEQLAQACDANTFVDKDEKTLLEHYNKLRFAMNEAIAQALQGFSGSDGRAPLQVPQSMKRHVEWMKHHHSQQQVATPAQGISGPELEHLLQEIETLRPAWGLHTTVVRELMPILTGQSDPLQVIFGSDQADTFYADMFSQVCDHRLRKFLELATHENPCLRILEVGAGTGGMTARVLATLQELEKESGALKFAGYTYTDVSPAFLERAGKRWEALGGRMAFKTFDMKVGPDKQGFELGCYDMIVAGSVLHATEDLLGTVRNVRKLLKPAGHLVILEAIAPDDVASNFTFGLVPGWWGSREEWRGLSPAIPEHQWDMVLKETGFSGNDLCLRDFEDDACHLFSVIVTRAQEEPGQGENMTPTSSPLTVVVCGDDDGCQTELANLIRTQLAHGHPQTRVMDLDHVQDNDLASDETVICIAEMRRPIMATASASRFTAIQDLIKRTPRLLWVTVATSQDERAPEYNVIQGLMRTVRAEEVSKRLVTLAIDLQRGDDATACATYIAKAFEAAFHPLSKESEYIVRSGLLTTGRVIQDVGQNKTLQSLLQPRLQQHPWLAGPALKLAVGASKTLESLCFVEDEAYHTDLDPHEVEIEAKTWAVNFRDVLVALGRIDDGDLGVDCAGVVTRVGASCDPAIRPGDRVCMVSPSCMRAYPRAPDKAVLKIPEELSFEAAASVLIPGMTAYYGLLEIARLRQGDKILIHSAAGSTGQMAVWVAKMQGAEVFATTSSDKKRQFLRDTMGIPEDHIFFSRDTSFAQGIKRVTDGYGVDVVLNSLSGDGLRASWECMAPFGRFIDMAEADIRSNSMLPMGSFAHNVSFSAIDLRHVAQSDLNLTSRLLRGTIGLLTEGKIRHPAPLNSYPVSELERAFRHLQGGKNIGRIMITLDRSDIVPQLLLERQSWRFDENASYLIAGGLGGLGRAIARWMVDRGAKHLILPSRSGAISKAALELVSELTSRSVKVTVPKCDVSCEASLARLLDDCADTMPPIKGCINAAMVLQDAVFENMTHEQWDRTIKSKVQTSWNLHRQLPQRLDFFILLSSLIGVLGGMGQSNYAAGCSFQDALARHRVRNGQKAVSIDVGWMRSIGIVAEKASYQRNLKTSEDMQKLNQDELLALLTMHCDPAQPVLSEQQSQVLFGLRTPDEFLSRGSQPPELLDRPLFKAFSHTVGIHTGHAAKSASSAVDQPAVAFRQAVDTGERIQVVIKALKQKLARAMAITPDDVELGKPLSSYGVDSLMAVELRNWIGKDFAANVAVFDIMGNVSIARIGELVVTKSSVGKS